MLNGLSDVLFLLCVLFITAAAIRYIAGHRDYRQGVLHKLGDFLLYGYLTAMDMIGYGKEMFKIRLKVAFGEYQPDGWKNAESVRKEIRMRQLQRRREDVRGRGRGEIYNLKILR